MPWSVGAATLPKQGQSVPGDAAWTWSDESWTRVVVVDGVGHGRRAALALQQLQTSEALQPATDIAHLLHNMHAALQGTIGAACMVADAHFLDGSIHLRCAGVGNVRLWTQRSIGASFEGRPGVLGQRFPNRIDVRSCTLGADERIFLATDGVQQNVEPESRLLPLDCMSLNHVHTLLHAHHNPADDGTLVVLCHCKETV